MDAFLDLEKRTGISDADLSDFERKASEVQRIITGLKDGTISPDAVPKVEGIKTAEELEEEERAKERRRIERTARRTVYVKLI